MTDQIKLNADPVANKKNIEALVIEAKRQKDELNKLQEQNTDLRNTVSTLLSEVQQLRTQVNVQKAQLGPIGSTT